MIEEERAFVIDMDKPARGCSVICYCFEVSNGIASERDGEREGIRP